MRLSPLQQPALYKIQLGLDTRYCFRCVVVVYTTSDSKLELSMEIYISKTIILALINYMYIGVIYQLFSNKI